ncbi:23155_t:CDS:2 [Entrophospora sp. SA101]|nr:6912_t:CDS:2 [Entrophospora sp. SA101]CAJ0761278.1 23155_t:CDS:2 [Entrophospora sp. SA101]CAJ0830120.1 2510_t:CDS:2 [Entrophospora sp. SA101]CAJ0911575.1 22655_t:CDS:2 [Entrophospora sp. SA101]
MSTTTTGKKTQYRHPSINTISVNSLTENLLAAQSIQHFDDNNNTRQYTSQQNMLFDSPKNQNLNVSIIKEKTTNMPSLYDSKKQRKPVDGSCFSPKSSGLDIKTILFYLIFLWALVVFLSSLCGIGPVDEELLFVKNAPINYHSAVANETMINDDEEEESPIEEINAWERITQSSWETTTLSLNTDVDDNNNLDIDITTDEGTVDQEIDKENIVENDPSIPENIITTQNEIVDVKANLESSDNSINLTQIGVANKLKKNKKTRYEIAGAFNEDDIVFDYSNYTYPIVEPHFTHIDVVGSLSIKERREFVALQRNINDGLDHSCGSWQDKYTTLHEKILNGTAPQRYVSYICEAKINCGGLADRILGMTSTFLFALLTDRAFLADWQVPLPLDTIFDSSNIDWSYDSFNSDYLTKDLNTTELNIIDYNSKHLDYHFSLSNWTTRYPEPFIKFYTNQGLIQRAFDSKYYSSKLKEMGLRPHTAFGCFLDYLFTPIPPALSFITQYTALFALPNIFSVGIHIQVGDSYEQSHLLQDYGYFFNCADQLTQTYAAPDQKVIYYLVTDSLKLRTEAYTKLEHVIISGLQIDSGHGHYDQANGVINAIIENSILSKTDYRVISQGNFGKLAAFHSKQLHSTVSLSTAATTGTKFLDCSREDIFTTFNQLANEWSII